LKQLDDYVAAQIAGDDYLARFTNVAFHLDACVQCADAYARLYELELAEAANRLPQPQQLSEPNLDFLQQGSSDLIAQLKKALRQTAEWVTLQLSVDLLPLLRPSPTIALTRAPDDSERYGEILFKLEPEKIADIELPVALTVYRDARQPELCLLEVVVEPPGLSWPDLEGRIVLLNVAGVMHEAVTDAWGNVSFADIAMEDLSQTTMEVKLVAE